MAPDGGVRFGSPPQVWALGRGRTPRLLDTPAEGLRLGCGLYFLRWWVPSVFAICSDETTTS